MFDTYPHRSRLDPSFVSSSCYFNPLVEGSAEAEAECDTAEAQEPAPQPVQKPAEAVEAAALMEVAAEVPLDAVHACSSGVSGRVTPGDALTKLSRSCSTGRSSWSSVSGASEVDVLAAAATAAVAPEAPATPLQCVSSQQLGLLHTLSTASSSSASGDRNSNQTLLVRQSASYSCEDASGVATAQPAEAPASACRAELAAARAAPSTSGINADERLERAQAHKVEQCPAAAAAAGSFAASFSSAAGRRHKRTQSSYLDLAVAAERLSEALSEHASYICLLPPPALRPASPQKAHWVSSPAVLAAYECLDSPQRQQPQMQTCNTQAVRCMESGDCCVGDSDESTGTAVATSIANHAAKQATEERSQEQHSAPEVWPEPAGQVHSPEPAPCPQIPCACGCMRAGCSVPGLCMTRALIKQMHLASRAALLSEPTEAPAEPSGAAGADTAAGHVSAGSPFAAAFASAEAALMGRSRAAAKGSCDGGGSVSSSEGGAVVTCVVVIPRPGTKCQLDADTEDQAPQVAAAEVGGLQGQEWLVARSTSSSSSESGESTASAALCSVHSSWRQPMTWTPLRERCAAARAPAPPGACVITAKGSEAVQAACVVEGPGVSCAELLTTGVTEPSAAAWLPLRERYAWMTRSGRQRGGLEMETRRV